MEERESGEISLEMMWRSVEELRQSLEDADASKSYNNILEKEQLCANAAPVETASHEKCSPLRLWPYSSAQPPASLKLCATIREIKL